MQNFVQYKRNVDEDSTQLRSLLLSSQAGSAPQGSHARNFNINFIRGITGNYKNRQLPGRQRTRIEEPASINPEQTAPAIWLQRTENEALRGFYHPPATAPLLHQALTSTTSFGPLLDENDDDVLNDPTNDGVLRRIPEITEDLFPRMSLHFRQLLLSGLTVQTLRDVGIDEAAARGSLGSTRSRWNVVFESPAARRQMTAYMKLVIARYATSTVEDNLPSRHIEFSTTFPRLIGTTQRTIVVPEGVIAMLHKQKGSIFSIIPSLRRISGYWHDNVRAYDGRLMRVDRNIDMMRRNIVEVRVGDVPIDWAGMMNYLYPILREDSLFTENDSEECYYCRIHIYSDNELIPRDISVPWTPEHSVDNGEFQAIVAIANTAIAKALTSNRYIEISNETRYTFFVEATWIRDPVLKFEFDKALQLARDFEDLLFGDDDLDDYFVDDGDGAEEDPLSLDDYVAIEGDPFAGEEDITYVERPRPRGRVPIEQRPLQLQEGLPSNIELQPDLANLPNTAPRRGRNRRWNIISNPGVGAPIPDNEIDFMSDAEEEEEDQAPVQVPYVSRKRKVSSVGSRVVRNRRRVAAPRAPTRRSARLQKKKKKSGLRAGAHVSHSEHELMYIKGSLLPRFVKEKALMSTPYRPNQTCTIMSLFRAERRIYTFVNGVVEAVDTGPSNSTLVAHEYMIPALDPERWAAARRKPMFFHVDRDGAFYCRLSHTYKHPDPTREHKYLPGVLDDEEAELWELGAESMCAYMEFKLERDIDTNDLDEVCQAFCDVFQLYVQVFDVVCRGKRIHIYTPTGKEEPCSRAPNSNVQIISIVYDQGHMHPISNLSSFLTTQKRDLPLRIHQFCPVCDKRTTACFNTKKGSLEHISQCFAQKKTFESGVNETIEKNIGSTAREVKQIWRQNPLTKKSYPELVCSTCAAPVTQDSYLHHACTLPRKEKTPLPDNKLYAYDLEAAQVRINDSAQWEHICNCVIVRKVYPDPDNPEELEGRHFENEVDFVNALLEDDEYEGATFLAHNGGGYDCQFLLKILERHEINHEYTPSPGSNHKFIQIAIPGRNIRLLDFMRFVCGSLRGIAKAFGCETAKGDFPHKFNNGSRMNYVGPLPPHNPDGEDYWCQHHAKCSKTLREFETWYHEEASVMYCTCYGAPSCTCGRPAWVFKNELIKYCRLDVVVLCEIIRLYREETMNLEQVQESSDSTIPWGPPPLDPFNYMTLPQLTINTLSNGFRYPEVHTIQTLNQRYRGGQSPQAILWMEQIAKRENLQIVHRGNHFREFYHFDLHMHFDGYCKETDTLFWFLRCDYWGCPTCNCEVRGLHPERGVDQETLRAEYDRVLNIAGSKFNLRVIWQHEYKSEWDQIDVYPKKVATLMDFSEAFYGGRTEVFCPYVNAEKLGPDMEIQYYDVTSLYPSVYLKTLPTGTPTHLLATDIDIQRIPTSHPEHYFGYVRCKVRPNPHCTLGLLPQRDAMTGRLTFPVHEMEGSWGTEELSLAMSQGYEIIEVYEAYVWAPDQCSDQYLRGYVSYFLRMKQEAEGWKKLGATSATPSEAEQKEIIERLYEQNGYVGRIRPEKVCVNPVKRALAKLYLNSLWGKFAQKSTDKQQKTLYGPAHFMEVWGDPAVKKETFEFRETAPGTYKATYETTSPYRKPVGHGNLLFGAKVTEHARCVLHTQMIEIIADGGEIIYCDTDSIIFARKKGGRNLLGIGLGKWTDEYPDDTIKSVIALAPKMYMLEFADHSSVRAKGVPLTIRNKQKLAFDNVKPLLLPIAQQGSDIEAPTLALENFSIFTNARDTSFQYATMLSRENEKEVRVVLSKRVVQPDSTFSYDTHGIVKTYPFGYRPPN